MATIHEGRESPKPEGTRVEDELYKYTFSGDWDEVVSLYETERGVQSSSITSSNDTALHMAINDDREYVVEELVRLIVQSRNYEALKSQNNSGETPLHRAAARGSARMCKCIVEAVDEMGLDLLSITNKLGETPIFTAAIHNRKPAFIFLYEAVTHRCEPHSEKPNQLLRRTGGTGDTVLHSAIRREHFDLALHIIQRCPDLMEKFNVNGMTPLHVLASKPSAFRSSCSLPWWKQIIYYCIYINPPKYEADPPPSSQKSPESSEAKWLPENYLTCYQFFSEPYSGNKKNGGDAENPRDLHTKEIVPQNYATCYEFLAFVYVFLSGILGFAKTYYDLKDAKRKHTWSVQILNELMEKPGKAYVGSGGDAPEGDLDFPRFPFDRGDIHQEGPDKKTQDQNEKGTSDPALLAAAKGVIEAAEKTVSKLAVSFNDTSSVNKNILLVAIKNKQPDQEEGTTDTALQVAAKKGVLEVVQKILSKLPVSIHDTSSTNKNILLVVENKQPEVVEALCKYLTQEANKTNLWHDLVQSLDSSENTILHLAAKYDKSMSHPWNSHGSAMLMQWEIKWFEYVKSLTPPHFVFLDNKNGQTPEEIFTSDHDDLVRDSGQWLKDTSESCSVVAALVAGVSFATSSQVPGGNDEKTGKPKLEGKPTFELFAITSLIGLCFSVTALIMFLTILTSRKQPRDFKRSLPMKLLLGLSSLFVSISSMLIAFCAAHFFLIDEDFKKGVFPLYAATCLPASYYAIAQFPLYLDHLRAIVMKVPKLHL
ncbi:uncharacterized protein LOC129309601 isoform X2 [Prosopis cineraria]|uniref:uncharacterized protein LOC129309601 isoform X2 n=1 Tax=Prosopis cineraria TaxID=364024 RepID=UPI00240F644B|nr:uncharacterized protein LOC129309601 isoform X2 [Prosopis cineraria]